MLGHPPSVAQHLAANVLTDGGGSIQLEQHIGLQQVLGPVHLKVGHGSGQPHPLVLDVEHHVLLVQLVRDKVDAPESGVLVAGVEALEAVGNAELGAILCKRVRVVGTATHGTIPVSNQSVSHHERDIVWVGPAASLDSNGNVSKRHCVVADSHIRSSVPAVHVNRSLMGDINSNFAKVLLSQFAQLSMVNTASSGKHHAGALVVGLDVVDQVIPGDGLDVLGGAQDGPAKGGALVGDCVQVVKDDLLQVHLDLLHLAQDNPTLALNLLLAECGVGEDVTQDFDSAVQVAREAFGVEDSLLPAGVGIQVSSHVLNLKLQTGLGSLGSAFEGHVL